MYVERLTIKNFKCFENVTFALNHPGKKAGETTPSRLPNVNLFLGNNGTGKTTVFQALTIAALKTVLATTASGFRTERMVRHGTDRADAITLLQLAPIDTATNPDRPPVDQRPMRVTSSATINRRGTSEFLEMRGASTKWGENLFDENHPGLFAVAYGAGRRTSRREEYNGSRFGTRYHRIVSLFELVPLVPLSVAYAQSSALDRWGEIIGIVNGLLPDRVRLTDKREDDAEPMFDFEGVPLPIHALSDGFRLFVGWVVDLLTYLSRVLPKKYALREAVGIVIVDEVDLFLSPAWQRTVLESLANTFPNIQWLCSTHSPLVAGSLESDHLFILERVAPYTSDVRRPSETFEGKSVEIVLAELFGVNQSRSPEAKRQLRELARRAMEGDIDASIEYLRLLNVGTGRK